MCLISTMKFSFPSRSTDYKIYLYILMSRAALNIVQALDILNQYFQSMCELIKFFCAFLKKSFKIIFVLFSIGDLNKYNEV